MGFYNLNKLLKENTTALHELEINGQKQEEDDEENTDYTGDDGDDDGDPEADDGSGGVSGGSDGVPGGEGEGEEPDAVGVENEDDETDYTIPDDAEPEAQQTNPEDQGVTDELDTDYTGGDDDATDNTGGEGEGTDNGSEGGSDNTEPGSGELPDGDDLSGDYTEDPDAGASDGSEENPDVGDGSENAEGVDTGSELNDQLKTAEDQVLVDLSDAQKKIQSDELRQNFIDMYNIILDVIDKVNNIHKQESTLQVFEFISSQLLILKDIVNTTITRTFDTKTYFENNVTYQQCMAILNTTKDLIDETGKKIEKNKES